MAYQNNIPQPSDQLSQSQSDFLVNFQALQILIDVNHVDFASGDQGKHKFITFPLQGTAPTFNVGEVGLYNLLDSTSTVNQLFVTNSAGTTYPVTASGGPIGLGVNGYCYLPSGQKLRWGSATTTGTTVTVNLAAPPSMFPAINQIFTIQLTAINTNCIFWATASTGGTFTVNSSVANSTFNYLVIGQ